jgi:hypothetical protein
MRLVHKFNLLVRTIEPVILLRTLKLKQIIGDSSASRPNALVMPVSHTLSPDVSNRYIVRHQDFKGFDIAKQLIVNHQQKSFLRKPKSTQSRHI